MLILAQAKRNREHVGGSAG